MTPTFSVLQEAPGSATPQSGNTSLDDHERRISHSLYGGLEGLDDNLMPRQGLMPRTIGKAAAPSLPDRYSNRSLERSECENGNDEGRLQ